MINISISSTAKGQYLGEATFVSFDKRIQSIAFSSYVYQLVSIDRSRFKIYYSINNNLRLLRYQIIICFVFFKKWAVE